MKITAIQDLARKRMKIEAPQNIVIKIEGKKFSLKISDFDETVQRTLVTTFVGKNLSISELLMTHISCIKNFAARENEHQKIIQNILSKIAI